MQTPKRHYGLLPTTIDHRDYLFRAPRQYSGQFVNLSSGIVEILDQLNLGSCVPHGVRLAVQFALKKNGQPDFKPSRLFIYWNGRVIGKYPLNQDTGLQIRDGVQSVVQFGAPPESEEPYDVSRFAEAPSSTDFADGLQHQVLKYAAVAPDEVNDAVASGYPVIQGWDVYPAMETNEVANTGILPMPKSGERTIGGHCTVIMSTPKDGAEIGGIHGMKYNLNANSWGYDWGLRGLFWQPVPYIEQYSSDFWVITGVEDSAVVPPPPPHPTDIDQALANVLKAHVNSIRPASVRHAAVTWLGATGL